MLLLYFWFINKMPALLQSELIVSGDQQLQVQYQTIQDPPAVSALSPHPQFCCVSGHSFIVNWLKLCMRLTVQ